MNTPQSRLHTDELTALVDNLDSDGKSMADQVAEVAKLGFSSNHALQIVSDIHKKLEEEARAAMNLLDKIVEMKHLQKLGEDSIRLKLAHEGHPQKIIDAAFEAEKALEKADNEIDDKLRPMRTKIVIAVVVMVVFAILRMLARAS